MKTKYLLISFVFAAFLSSSMPQGSHSLEVGKEAPSITLSSDSRVKDLDDIQKKFVIVNFWSASDPQSRINNKRLADIISTLPASQIQFIGICTDPDEEIAREIIKADNISESAINLFASDISPEVTKDYQVGSGNRSFMIDPYGNLMRISPEPEDIPDSIIS